MSRRSGKKRTNGGRRTRRALRRLFMGGTVTVATVGCSTCTDNGAVDPPPPPLNCGDVDSGQSFIAQGTVADTILTVELIETSPAALAEEPVITGLTGVTLDSLEYELERVTLHFSLDSDTTTTGQFTVSGRLTDGRNTCPFNRTFVFMIDSGNVEVTLRERVLPLGHTGGAKIELVRRVGLEVTLRAIGPSSDSQLLWTVTGGSCRTEGEDGLVWTLPGTRGFHQVQLMVDHGPDGFGFDALTLEVL